jgi:hypothetical protein
MFPLSSVAITGSSSLAMYCIAVPLCLALPWGLQALQQSRFGCVLIEHGPPSEPAVHYLRQIENAFATIVDGG